MSVVSQIEDLAERIADEFVAVREEVSDDLSGKSDSGHNHDGSYSATSHNHDSAYSATGHNHDGSYAATSHNHDSAYYTESEIDSKLLPLIGVTTANPSSGSISIDASTVTRSVESTLTGAATLNVPTNGANGQVIECTFLASSAQRVLTFHGSFARLDGVGSTLTIASGKVGRATIRRTNITGSTKWIVEASGVEL